MAENIMRKFEKAERTGEPQGSAGPVQKMVSCHAGSLYGRAIVLYEKPKRDDRVFVAIIKDETLRWKIYCNDICISNIKDCGSTLFFDGVNYADVPVFEIDASEVMRQTMRIDRCFSS